MIDKQLPEEFIDLPEEFVKDSVEEFEDTDGLFSDNQMKEIRKYYADYYRSHYKGITTKDDVEAVRQGVECTELLGELEK